MNSHHSKGIKAKKNIDSPKTPGGISKSLLTPCRRVGLSRNWGKKGTSPFISPLSCVNSNSTDVSVEQNPKKRKRCKSDDNESASIDTSENDSISTPKSSVCDTSSNINNTPIRNVPFSKKKSKTLLMKDIKESVNTDNNDSETLEIEERNSYISENIDSRSLINCASPLAKLSSTISKNKLKNAKLSGNNIKIIEKPLDKGSSEKNFKCEKECKETSPNNLTKECIVIIQKKMIKSLKLDKIDSHDKKQSKPTSQTLFDSDSDTPLCDLSKKENINNKKYDEDDFTDTKVIKLQDKNTSTSGLKTVKMKNNVKKLKPKTIKMESSQNSTIEDDDDFECHDKRTILIKKSYDKVVKPSKAKSTGSITQGDLDEIKARIEMKRKLLVAKAMSKDTEELRNLIKKWQKGCQEALFELFDLMRKKFPDKRNMDYFEILQTLNIPPDLVGYDADNDCFVTPDDSSVILSSINT